MTIKDIAKQAGVSTATVSYVMNGTKHVSDDKRRRVNDVIEKTNYQPNRMAKSLRIKKTNVIGVLAEDILAFPSAKIINGISEYVEQTDYHILLNDLRLLESLLNKYDQVTYQKERINSALSLLVYGAKVDAVIYIGMFNRDIPEILADINKPIVVAYSTSSDPSASSVTYDSENICAQITQYILEKGHRDIAVITGPLDTMPTRERLKGILKATKGAGITLDDAMIKSGDWGRESGYIRMNGLLRKKNGALPTAVIAMNDIMAAGAIDAIREAGLRVPEDISIVGFDNREISEYTYPKLTTAEIDLKRIGYKAAEEAARRISDDGENSGMREIIVPSKIIIRDTVKDITK
ncbi:MAG: LacI family transcriptional regulator [Oscillospiraceae bacterium]|nr:LacI family transcriptional regulator [Oscillospiraceae bacterium]